MEENTLENTSLSLSVGVHFFKVTIDPKGPNTSSNAPISVFLETQKDMIIVTLLESRAELSATLEHKWCARCRSQNIPSHHIYILMNSRITHYICIEEKNSC